MIKKLCIILLLLSVVAPTMAQQQSGEDVASFAPKKGNWQVSAVMGSSNMFDLGTEHYLLSDFQAPNTGLGDGSLNQSQSPSAFLNLEGISNSSLVNLIGLQGSYFITENISVNAMFSMNINLTPKRDYIEGDDEIPGMEIPGVQYVEGQLKNNWATSVGANYYFNTKNERINLYAGALLGWQMGRIKTQTPYTGNTVTDPDTEEELPLELYYPNNNSGQIWGANGSLVAGVEYSLAEGLIIGFEVRPLSYTFNKLSVCPPGYDNFHAENHSVNVFALPNLKFGFRF